MNNKVYLWRGLCFDDKSNISLEKIKDNLLTEGDALKDKQWMRIPNIAQHNNSVDLIVSNLLNENPEVERYGEKCGKYACGDTIGADYYATRYSETGIVLFIKTDIDRLVIDGRDFLYTVIPKIIEEDTLVNIKIKDIFEKAFGKKSIDYIEKGKKLKNAPLNIIFRFVDYFCADLEIINSNLKSDVLIYGRHGTKFKSSFAIIDGIKPEEIVEFITPGISNIFSYKYILKLEDFYK